MRDFLAQERAQLERKRRLKEDTEQRDADLARQLQEQEMHGSEPMDTSEPARSCHGDIYGVHPSQAHAPGNASSPILPSPSYLPTTPVNAVSSSNPAPVLPDSIPVIIASSPISPQFHFHCHSISPGYPQYNQFPRTASPGAPIAIPDSPPAVSPLGGHGAPAGPSTSTGGSCGDISEFQRKIEADARAKARREVEDERLAKLLQAEEAQAGEALKGRQSDLDAQLAAKIMAELLQADQESANRDAELAAQAWAAEQRLAEEAEQREQQVIPHEPHRTAPQDTPISIVLDRTAAAYHCRCTSGASPHLHIGRNAPGISRPCPTLPYISTAPLLLSACVPMSWSQQ